MPTVLVDSESGNLHSALKAFQRMARETGAGEIVVSNRPEDVARADRIVLPGDGAFPACMAALRGQSGLHDALIEAVETRARPFLGICVGMQLMARRGHEHGATDGFGWIDGEVRRIAPADPALKVPHMGWNDLVIDRPHPVLDGITTGDHAYFVHSYQMDMDDPDAAARALRLWRGGDRNRRGRHPDRHPVSPREEPVRRPAADRQLPALEAMILPGAGRAWGYSSRRQF